MNPIWENKFRVRAFDVDSNDRMKVNTILDYFQDVASSDAERLNFGYTDFVPRGLTWVLSWAKFEFIHFPKFAEEVKIQTWGKKQYKLYSLRDYLLFNSKDEVICKGTSAWLLLDSKSMRPKILPQLFPEIKMLENKDALTDLPEKIIPSSKSENVYSTKIRYSDIDLNQHANNATYIRFMLDCFDQNFYKEHLMRTLIVSFNAESKYGDEIQLSKGTEKTDPLTHHVEVKNMTSNKPVFNSLIEWR
jgi:medium-chain acyl-[acyl-carrier-protein] hydrolase